MKSFFSQDENFQASGDLLAAYYLRHGCAGFIFPDSDDYQMSEGMKSRLELAISARLGELMNDVRQIMIRNYSHLIEVRNELSAKGVLTYRDLEALGHLENNDDSHKDD